MKRKILLSILSLFLVFVFAGNIWAADESECPVMPAGVWVKWLKASKAAPKAEIKMKPLLYLVGAQALDYGTSMDLVGHLDYDPAQRNQGGCGNCWVWACTGVMEIAHDVDYGVFDRLSIQYLDSCKTDNFACCGGNAGAFATWYSGQGRAIPWDNTNASFADGSRGCADGTLVTCASIAKTPNYPINSIAVASIGTHSGQATAIANIKNILNQDKGVIFGFALPDSAAWNNFRSFWRCDSSETEATLWNDVDSFCGTEWDGGDGGTAGAHAVVIYGYNDDAADSANHYWLVLNSWGTAGGDRPNGFYRVPMMMNYDCSYPDDVNPPGYWAFSFETLNVVFGNALPIADANGPYNEECGGMTTAVALDGSGSFDLEGPLSYAWNSNCPGQIFDNYTSATPVLTIDTSPGCSVSCNVTLTVTDSGGASDADTTTVTIADTTPPDLTCPADVTIECDELPDPSDTGFATATDICDPSPVIDYLDDETPGACAAEETISRTWTATDACGNASTCVQTINVVDTTPPDLTCPDDITIECDESILPVITGSATAMDNCDSSPVIVYSDVETPGACAAEKTITRTWMATDECGNVSTCDQIITVVDTTPPVIACNAPATIIPPDAPISFTATAIDNCDPAPMVSIIAYDCYSFTKKGKRIDKTESCIVNVAGDTITILDSGGVDDTIIWTVRAVDECGNVSEVICMINVVKP